MADRGWVLHAVSWPLLGLSVLFTAMRFWVRIRIIKSCGWDDAFNVLALLCAATNTGLVVQSVAYGTGRHINELSHDQQVNSAKYQLLSQGFHVMSTNWGKVSVALFLIRIISGVKQHKRAMYAGIGILSIINILGVYTIYGQCTPTTRIWDRDIPGTCWRPGAQRSYAYFQGSASAFSDFVLAVYPLFTIQKLQMALKVKFGLGFVLSLGIIAMIAAIIKTIHLSTLSSETDSTWDMVPLTIWVAVEQYLIIIAACIPALTPLFNIIVRHRSSKRSRSNPVDLQMGSSQLRKSSRHQQYLPFASVGREYVEYPMNWVRSGADRGSQGSGSGGGYGYGYGYPDDGDGDGGSEVGITGKGDAEMQQGILRTTEFRIKEVVTTTTTTTRPRDDGG
ncbi:uncharacterized protein BJX67DRAFT_379060 [Aspergillus lucknowensis]|uniref:Rhodopsin domain-containing protein n=1 Tax=Aspergillus lucknowensis TaxID=176173 RepID=A0ABR4LYB4_9EURO